MAGKTTRVVMPQLGESVHEGTISRWLVKPGDQVVEFEPMLEVDTDKVNAEVPAPVSGILREILAKEGETVQAGAEIAVVETGGDSKVTATPEAPAPAPKEEKLLPTGGEVPAKPAEGRKVEKEQLLPTGGEVPAKPAEGPAPSEPHRYSPGVQMAASDLKVDLSQVTGTGLGGRVTKKDVQDFAASAKAAPAARPAPAASVAPGEGDQVVQLTRVRRLIAENMTRSKSTIPHAWQTQEVDMSGVVANRNANKAAFQKQEGFSLTYLPYVMAAALSALREHPEVNSSFNETELIVHRDINLGISVGLEDTLLVPVVRRADGLSIAGLARAVNDLATRARNKQLKADELSGGTFTVNNSGTFGTLFSYSVINPGQAGILTMEAIVDRPMAVNGMIGIKPMMYLCFSFDHRVLDGLQAARFLTSCRKWLEAVSLETPVY
ncbi:MAG: 2-oxo acid dehydrogenase subunit E2 [Chloroflexi bacterium]|nr:MAG: 2-oxo acid dehydrogenase subunit E2 [Chloroflexota bacterium]TMF83392.1 MAG: 2-oxo acid dehydrogenase subunit E2 [Chloroflexota bacterium]TMG12035.1 MAG: 2-oxo acid dehydrogenase subunit E2 [Chloroflexota bacterium]